MVADVLTLVKETRTQDRYGVWQTTETTRDVFCEVESVTRSEFFDAGRNGLNPEYVFTIFFDDYEDETVCEYKGKRYGIYRTYHDSDDLELYAERKGGTNRSGSDGSS